MSNEKECDSLLKHYFGVWNDRGKLQNTSLL